MPTAALVATSCATLRGTDRHTGVAPSQSGLVYGSRPPPRGPRPAPSCVSAPAEEMRQDAMHQLGVIGGTDPALPEPSGSPLGDALNAVVAAAYAAITQHGFGQADLWPLLGRFGLARHLAPARSG
jgi:hypothetical protein